MATKKHFHLTRTVERHILDRTIYIASFAGPMTAMPQIYTIFATQSATGVSIWSWILGLGFSAIWITYALFYRIKPILVSQCLWVMIDLIIIVGIMMYNQDVRLELPYEQLLMLNHIGKYATIIGILAGVGAIYVYLLQQRTTRRA
jgi:uncharacterized protein with PQ loop repeat